MEKLLIIQGRPNLCLNDQIRRVHAKVNVAGTHPEMLLALNQRRSMLTTMHRDSALTKILRLKTPNHHSRQATLTPVKRARKPASSGQQN